MKKKERKIGYKQEGRNRESQCTYHDVVRVLGYWNHDYLPSYRQCIDMYGWLDGMATTYTCPFY